MLNIMSEKDDFMNDFEGKLKKKLDLNNIDPLSKKFINLNEDLTSNDYEQFRIEALPTSFGLYEKLCYYSEKFIGITADSKTSSKVEKDLSSAHLNISAKGVMSLAVGLAMFFLLLGITIMLFAPIIGIGFIIIGFALYFIMQKIPSFLAKKLRARANDEIIIAIFYIVAFMRFSSNFELAISFAANYLSAPLSLDFKRLLWELENTKYPTVKAAFDIYLEGWRDDNLEFLEAIYLIESSLYESEEFRRIGLLDKSLDIILQGNYEKMLHFAQNLKGKVQTFNMIGVVLPILGLIILPLAASFGNPKSVLQVVFLLYNIIIPAAVGYFGFMIVFNRPSSVNSIKTPKSLKGMKNLMKYPFKVSKDKIIYLSPKIPAIVIFFTFLLIGLSPIIFHNIGLDTQLNSALSNIVTTPSSPFSYFESYKLIDKGGVTYPFGPYGVYPGILSLFLPLAFAFGIGYYLKYKYQNLIHIRDKAKKLEKQFPSATFQLGNRINEGISAELAFGAVAETMKGTEAGDFFSIIDTNIKFNGMSVETAIFDKEKGALIEYPSDLVLSSMKILVRAIDNGPDITAKTLVDLSKYLTEIHMSNERMLDLLGDSLGSMKGQASFLAPLISGVVISIVSLVTMILGTLSKATTKLAASGSQSDAISGFLGDSIPTYLFQSVVGIYMVFLIIILMYIVTNLESGDDEVNTKYMISKMLLGGITKYAIVVSIGVIGFSFVGSKILGSIV